MTYRIHLGDYSFSSWSLRGWLLLHRWSLPMAVTFVDFGNGPVAQQMAAVSPARTVPTMITPEGTAVWDSLAIAEELASRHPEAAIWPADPAAPRHRPLARRRDAFRVFGAAQCLPDEPAGGLCGLRPIPEVLADLERIETLWAFARAQHVSDSPWLCGDYSAADAFFAPVAMRIAGYGLPVSAAAQDYVDAHLSDPALRRWRAMGHARGTDLPQYARDYTRKPGPAPHRSQRKPWTRRGACGEYGLSLFRRSGDAFPRDGGPRLRFLQCVLPRQDRCRPGRMACLHGA